MSSFKTCLNCSKQVATNLTQCPCGCFVFASDAPKISDVSDSSLSNVKDVAESNLSDKPRTYTPSPRNTDQSSGNQQPSDRPIWEYHGISLQVGRKQQERELANIISQINRLGAAGWEMVGSSTLDIFEDGAIFKGQISGHDTILFFKRQVNTGT